MKNIVKRFVVIVLVLILSPSYTNAGIAQRVVHATHGSIQILGSLFLFVLLKNDFRQTNVKPDGSPLNQFFYKILKQADSELGAVIYGIGLYAACSGVFNGARSIFHAFGQQESIKHNGDLTETKK